MIRLRMIEGVPVRAYGVRPVTGDPSTSLSRGGGPPTRVIQHGDRASDDGDALSLCAVREGPPLGGSSR